MIRDKVFCYHDNRKYIGLEVDKKYCRMWFDV